MNKTMLAGLAATAAMAGTPATAQMVTHNGTPQAFISTSTVVPAGATTMYVSGLLADPVDPAQPNGDHGDTYTQAKSVFKKITAELAKGGMTPGDVVMMRVFLVAPPGQPKMDFAGMNKAYMEVFGTAAQPMKPARIAMQIASLAAPWGLVEIEAQAAKVMPK